MFNFLKKLFGIADAAAPQAPYKVEIPQETPVVVLPEPVAPVAPVVVQEQKPAEKAKSTAKKATKPKAAGGNKKPAARTAKPKASKPKE